MTERETTPVKPEHLIEGMIVRCPPGELFLPNPPEGKVLIDMRHGLDGATVWAVERFPNAFGPDEFRVEFSDSPKYLWLDETETVEVEC